MSQRCPVCKARLWSGSFFYAKLKCPRCSAEFRPKVPWVYVRVLLLLLLVLVLAGILFLTERNLWLIFVFLGGTLLLFWLLPRFVDLERIPGELKMADGPTGDDPLKLKFRDWEEREEKLEEGPWGGLLLLLVGLVLLFCLLLLLK